MIRHYIEGEFRGHEYTFHVIKKYNYNDREYVDTFYDFLYYMYENTIYNDIKLELDRLYSAHQNETEDLVIIASIVYETNNKYELERKIEERVDNNHMHLYIGDILIILENIVNNGVNI